MKYAVHGDVKAVVEKPDANRPLGRSKYTRGNNIETDLKKWDGKVFEQVRGALL
jgi:hypothetical protein